MKWGPDGGEMAERVRDNGKRERERSEEEEEVGSHFKDLFFFFLPTDYPSAKN